MTIKQSESVFDPIELDGLWWCPALGENAPKYSGALRYKVGEERELKLWGCLDLLVSSEEKNFDVICGACPGNKLVTLFGCSLISFTRFSGTSSMPMARIGFTEMWVGPRMYERKEDLCFQEFTFGINNLEQWRNAKSFTFHSFGDGFERVDLSYVRPESILFYEDERAIIRIVYHVGPLASSMGQKSFTVEHAARIQITAKNGTLPFYGDENSIHYYQDAVFQFFTLLIGGSTFIYNCEGISNDSIFPEVEAEYFQARSLSKEQTASITEWEMFLPYKSLGEKITGLFFNFIAQWDLLQPYVPQFTAFQNHVFDWTFHTLPELLYTFEGLERTLYNHPRKSKREKVCLQERFDAVYIDCVAQVFHYLDSNRWAALTKKLKNEVRDAHSHGDANAYQTFSTDHNLDYNCCRWMTLLMTAMVFHKCGLSPEEIHACFIANEPGGYNWIKAVFEKSDLFANNFEC